MPKDVAHSYTNFNHAINIEQDYTSYTLLLSTTLSFYFPGSNPYKCISYNQCPSKPFMKLLESYDLLTDQINKLNRLKSDDFVVLIGSHQFYNHNKLISQQYPSMLFSI